MAGFFSDLLGITDPMQMARLRGGLVGASQSISQPYANLGNAFSGGAMGAEQGRQQYADERMGSLKLKLLETQLTQDKEKRDALNNLFKGLVPQAPVQNVEPIAEGVDENGAPIPQAPQMGQRQEAPFRLPAGFNSAEQFQAFAQIDPEGAMKLMFQPPEKPIVGRPGDVFFDPVTRQQIASVPDRDKPPTVTGGMFWDQEAKTFKPVPGYEEQARRIADAGRSQQPVGDGYRLMTPEEKKAANLPTDSAYQVSRTGKIERVAGNTSVRQVPSMALAGMTANRNTLRKIDEALAALDTDTGRGAVGYKYGFSDAINQRLNPGGVPLRAVIADIGSQKLHDRSGASVTISEAPRLQPFVPSVADTPEALRSKLMNLKAEYQANVDEADSFYSPEAGYMRLPEKGAEKPANTKPPAVTPPSQAIQMLKMNPKLAADFDKKYGAGAAKRVLGK